MSKISIILTVLKRMRVEKNGKILSQIEAILFNWVNNYNNYNIEQK